MKILQVHKFYYQKDGATNYMLFLSSLLENAGHTVIPFSMKGKRNRETPFEKYFVSELNLRDTEDVSFLQKISTAKKILYNREAKKNLQKLLLQENIDVAHLHNIYHHIGPSILRVLKKRGIKIIMTLHDLKLLSPNYIMYHHGQIHEEDAKGWYTSCIKNKCVSDSTSQSALLTFEMIFHHKIMKYYERYVDKFIAPSEFLLNKCVEYGWPREKFVHIPHPVDMKGEEMSYQDGEGVVYAGRISEEKGVRILLDAAMRTPHIPYSIIGEGPELPALHLDVKRKGMKNVTFLGFQEGGVLKKSLQKARILVLPSLCYENAPLSILEGQALGKVVLSSDTGGTKELLESEFLFKRGDSEGLAKKIDLWYNKASTERKKLGMRMQKEVLKAHDQNDHLKSILRLYRAKK